MVQSYLLLGFLTALCQPAYGLVFRDRIKQDVGGQALYLLHNANGPASVSFSDQQIPGTKGWKFDTEGYPDDVAVITPLELERALICEVGSVCALDLGGKRQAYVIARVPDDRPIFTFQDTISELYVSRTIDNELELTENLSEKSYFELEKLQGKHVPLPSLLYPYTDIIFQEMNKQRTKALVPLQWKIYSLL